MPIEARHSGVRNSPFFSGLTIPKIVLTSLNTAGNVTYTAAQVWGGEIHRDTNGGNRTDTLPTAHDLAFAMRGIEAGSTIELVIRNDSGTTDVLTIAAGDGGTASGTLTVAQNTTNRFRIRFTNVSYPTEAYEVTGFTASSGGATTHNVLSATHGDTLADTVVRGDILYGNSTPKWARLAKPSVLSDLSHDGTDVSWVTASGTGAPVRAIGPALTGTPTINGVAAAAGGVVTVTANVDGTVTCNFATARTCVITQNGSANPVVLTITNIPTNEYVNFVFNFTTLRSVTWPANVKCSYGDSWTTVGSVNGYTTSGGKYTSTFWSDGTNLYATGNTGDIQTVNAAHVNTSAIAVYTIDTLAAGYIQLLFGSELRMNQSSYITFDTDAGIRRVSAGLLKVDNGAGTLSDLTLRNFVLDTSTGTKLGTATGQKLGFWNATPVVQQVLATGAAATVDNVITLLQTLGLCKQS